MKQNSVRLRNKEFKNLRIISLSKDSYSNTKQNRIVSKITFFLFLSNIQSLRYDWSSQTYETKFCAFAKYKIL